MLFLVGCGRIMISWVVVTLSHDFLIYVGFLKRPTRVIHSLGIMHPNPDSVDPMLSKEFSSETLAEGVRQLNLQQCKVEVDTQILEWEKELEVGFSKQDIIYAT